jgi:hypothetical protein
MREPFPKGSNLKWIDIHKKCTHLHLPLIMDWTTRRYRNEMWNDIQQRASWLPWSVIAFLSREVFCITLLTPIEIKHVQETTGLSCPYKARGTADKRPDMMIHMQDKKLKVH